MQPTIQYTTTKHARIRISPNGEVILKIPKHQEKNEDFKNKLLQKAIELHNKFQQKNRQKIETQKDGNILLFGEYISDKNIENIEIFLQEKIFQKALPLLQKYSEKIGIAYTKLTFGNYKSKWGSCSHDQKITLNLKLAHLPAKFLEYVIIHEVCHLKVKNHSKDFWKGVEHFLPNYKEIRKELKNYKI